MEPCPFSGKPCDKAKVVHVTEVAENAATKSLDICEGCGQNPPKLSFIANVLSIINGFSHGKWLSLVPAAGKPPCLICGTTLQDIAQGAKVGCGYCYSHFKQELTPVLVYAHQAQTHIGKKPKPLLPIPEQIALLKLKIKDLIKRECYEEVMIAIKELDALLNRPSIS